ncbi:MAG: 2OG-Fe(II) oxygenase [Betaproteobacteria bacterium]|nr:2OG-Fe(II) oxygenase [Betaproteobacteria bacterium]MDH5211431.1 2OG-Fe(II) oxygenase [Betaproteobacteria bacterium]
MSTELLDLEKLRAQPLARDPFPFVVVSGMLKPGVIKALSRDFPPIGDGGVYPVDVLALGPSMRKLVAEISGPEFRGIVEEKFGLDLEGRPPMVTLRGRSRDKDGRIHRDSDDKVVSLLLYLNEEWPHKVGNLRMLRSPEDLESTVAEIPSTAGTLVIFEVKPNGWHGHHKFVGERRVLMLNYMTGGASLARELKRHRFSAKVKGLKKLVGL